jgi:hypothetical protein
MGDLDRLTETPLMSKGKFKGKNSESLGFTLVGVKKRSYNCGNKKISSSRKFG